MTNIVLRLYQQVCQVLEPAVKPVDDSMLYRHITLQQAAGVRGQL